ncbi:glutaminase A [Mycobacterium sp. 94-17]|uniref:glutaminase A n=1 Tax=Mycobacterium sp. 94-17 TaxID=2986147 RepID=UPI002D1E78E8|nr:glutaminase A [Mycobacterium sp. 94-17]MEB4212047.1 glutaminase A [Mycobacterium sp. 94-17]
MSLIAQVDQAATVVADDFGSRDGLRAREAGGVSAIAGTFKSDHQQRVSLLELMNRLGAAGIGTDDPRIREILSAEERDGGWLSSEQFAAVCEAGGGLIARALRGDLVIPDFTRLAGEIREMYDNVRADESGVVADYIPQLKRVDPEKLAIAVCTVDGQRSSVGDTDVMFCVQSMCKPINYSLALEEHGVAAVHHHVGREPSGRGFNELSLTDVGLPHNPMINSGAIMTCSLLRSHDELADRFDHVASAWRRLSASGRVGFNNTVYLSERRTADRNYALGYFMREHDAFPQGIDLVETLEFYFQCCAIELDTHALAVVAATFANAGINPLTNEPVFKPSTVRHCLSLMSSCGMYDYSGEFAFTIGLPAKSGVSGGLMLVVPGVMGVCIWSPRLDTHGNSVRGVAFCRELVTRYNFHIYDSLIAGEDTGKRDPRRKKNESEITGTMRLLYAASQGDLDELRAVLATGADPSAADYDGRTALHLAAAEGHSAAVRYLLESGARPGATDRWGGTPLTDAKRAKHAAVAQLLAAQDAGAEPTPGAVTDLHHLKARTTTRECDVDKEVV